MKAQLTKGLTIVGIGAMMIGALAAGPAKADDRRDDSRTQISVRLGDLNIGLDLGGQAWGVDQFNNQHYTDRDNRRADDNRFYRRDDRR